MGWEERYPHCLLCVDLITPDHKANMPENVNNENILNTPVEKNSSFDLTLSDVSTLFVRYPIIELYTSYSCNI